MQRHSANRKPCRLVLSRSSNSQPIACRMVLCFVHQSDSAFRSSDVCSDMGTSPQSGWTALPEQLQLLRTPKTRLFGLRYRILVMQGLLTRSSLDRKSVV